MRNSDTMNDKAATRQAACIIHTTPFQKVFSPHKSFENNINILFPVRDF